MDSERIGEWVDAGASLLGLPVDADNRADVVLNLQRIAAIVEGLEAVELEPSVEPLPVFVR